jgi:antitoxin component YwqK of YwqJK toxin-antitoxin module
MRDFYLILCYDLLNSMKLRTLILIILAGAVLCVHAQKQEQLNQTDTKGMKQGHWIKKTPQGHIQYEGYFKDNMPVGQFKRHYDNDSLQSVLIYSADGKSADANFYHQNGYPASSGKYSNQMKEGKWKFYSAYLRDYLICEEEYLHNTKNGLSVKYYPNKTISEKLSYSNNVKSGEWNQYFPNGQVCLTGNFTEGLLNGKFVVYFDNGKPEFSGQYKSNSRDGNWIRYNRDGSVKTTITYVYGSPTNPELFRQETEYLDALEKNKGKIADPEKTGTIWQ